MISLKVTIQYNIKLYHWQNLTVACGLSGPMFYNTSQCQPFRNTPQH